MTTALMSVYAALHDHFGYEAHWWPIVSDAPQFEILVGAVLVQQTRWETVEAAVLRLLARGWLSPAALAAADTAELAALIRPCAFHTQKAPGLQAICRHLLARYAGDLGALLAQERGTARAALRALPRIGPETADTIMLYAGGHPAFIADAYARRLFARLDLVPGFDFLRASYDAVQQLIEHEIGDWRLETEHLGLQSLITNYQLPITNVFWHLHALINEECIHHCLATKPRCDAPGLRRRSFADPRKCAAHCVGCTACPLRAMCAAYQRGGSV